MNQSRIANLNDIHCWCILGWWVTAFFACFYVLLIPVSVMLFFATMYVGGLIVEEYENL